MKRIKSISVRNSSFFGKDFSIEFSEKLNCLMGGRGTGKSTLLHFIAATLGNESEEDEPTSGFLTNNLHNGTITIVLEDEDGKSYEVIKTLGEEPQPSQLPNHRHISMDSLAEGFECDIYPALSIEEIGRKSLDRLKLIDKRINRDVAQLKSDIELIQIGLNENAVSIRGENARVSQLAEQLHNFKTVDEDLKRHKEDKPEDINPKEQEEYERADANEKIRGAEKRYASKVSEKLSTVRSDLTELNEEIQNAMAISGDFDKFINKDVLSKIKSEFESASLKIAKDNEVNIALISKSLTKIKELSETLGGIHQQQQSDFFKLKQKLDKYKEYLNKYNQLTKRLDERTVLEKEVQEVEVRRKKLKAKRKGFIKQLNEKKKEIFTLRKKVADELNSELQGSVKVALTFGGITDPYADRLRNALRGSNIRYNAIIPYIVKSLTPDRFALAIHERDAETLRKILEIDEERSKTIINALYESEDIYEIEGLYCEDLPEFFLRIDAIGKGTQGKENYKPSHELSTGQRCTTVLPIVFAVSDNPLLIDQPEDNLDNRYITQNIHGIIRTEKEKRQLIFITHNPNIPVLSDAEVNLFLRYDDKESKIDSFGKVDDVKNNILNLLEGGKDAFERRKELYGF